MLDNPSKWLQRNWWGLIVAYLLLFAGVYLLIWQFAEPMGIPDSIENLPSFTKSRIFIHLVLTFLITPHIALVLDLMIRFRNFQGLGAVEQGVSQEKKLLERIGYDSKDTLAESCWNISETENLDSPTFKTIDDGFRGKVLQVSSTARYAADYKVKPQASLGNLVEIIGRADDRSGRLYVQVNALSRDGAVSKTVWFKLRIGRDKPSLVWNDGAAYEWSYSITPAYLDGNWLKLDIDLNKAIADTLGDDGWLLGRLKMIRLRGNLSLAYISIYS